MRLSARLFALCLGLPLALTGCSAPNHLGNPLTLPIRGVMAGIENASYASKRASVKTYITQNEAELRAEDFNGPYMAALLENIAPRDHATIRTGLRAVATQPDFAERATIIVMVHQ